MTLTEKWKKGELESGWYYVKGADGLIGMMSDYALYRVNLEHPDNEITLLAKMPSYEEWQQLHKFLEEFNALDVAKENQRLQMSLRMTVDDYKNVVDICEQLKELLRACVHFLGYASAISSDERNIDAIEAMVDKIKDAIGESEE